MENGVARNKAGATSGADKLDRQEPAAVGLFGGYLRYFTYAEGCRPRRVGPSTGSEPSLMVGRTSQWADLHLSFNAKSALSGISQATALSGATAAHTDSTAAHISSPTAIICSAAAHTGSSATHIGAMTAIFSATAAHTGSTIARISSKAAHTGAAAAHLGARTPPDPAWPLPRPAEAQQRTARGRPRPSQARRRTAPIWRTRPDRRRTPGRFRIVPAGHDVQALNPCRRKTERCFLVHAFSPFPPLSPLSPVKWFGPGRASGAIRATPTRRRTPAGHTVGTSLPPPMSAILQA